MLETYAGFVLPEGSKVERRQMSNDLMAVKTSPPGARQQTYAVFKETPAKEWRATGEELTASEVAERIRMELKRSR